VLQAIPGRGASLAERKKEMTLWEERENAYKNSLRFGLRELDEKTNGIPIHRLWAIGGRPGEGKTLWSLQLAMQWADKGKKVVYFSNEQDKTTINNQLAAGLCKIDSMDIAIGNLSPDRRLQVEQCWEHMAGIPLKIYDRMEAMDGMGIAKVLHEEKPDVFIYDNIQMIRKADSYQKKHEAIEDFLINMKAYIMNNPVVGILISQANRNAENRKNGLPSLGDLKDSGAIEQTCDGVALLCWPYRWFNNKNLTQNGECKFQYNEYFIEIAKNRYGRGGCCRVRILPNYGRVEDWI